MKSILIINGSASERSSNHVIVDYLTSRFPADIRVNVFDRLRQLPHFDPEKTMNHVPASILEFRELVLAASAVIFCTPEYIFSIPSGLKNALEWSVSTTIFEGRIAGVITASAHGEKGHLELQMILKTLQAELTEETSIRIQGVRGKINANRQIEDERLRSQLNAFGIALLGRITKRIQ